MTARCTRWPCGKSMPQILSRPATPKIKPGPGHHPHAAQGDQKAAHAAAGVPVCLPTLEVQKGGPVSSMRAPQNLSNPLPKQNTRLGQSNNTRERASEWRPVCLFFSALLPPQKSRELPRGPSKRSGPKQSSAVLHTKGLGSGQPSSGNWPQQLYHPIDQVRGRNNQA